MENKPVNIFWTGGWDSTFRLLQLLIVEKRRVQPYFVVRAQASVGKEINTMIDIRRELFRAYPETKELLLPTLYYDIKAIKNIEIFLNHLLVIRESSYLAKQYAFLAAFCEQHDINTIELSIIKNGSVIKLLQPLLDDDEAKIIQAANTTEIGEKLYKLFKYFEFPLYKYTKKEMKEYAKQKEFDDLLYMTWFCATPYKDQPCGFCGPCIDAIKMGFSDRIPIVNRQLSRLQIPLRDFYRKRFKKYTI